MLARAKILFSSTMYTFLSKSFLLHVVILTRCCSLKGFNSYYLSQSVQRWTLYIFLKNVLMSCILSLLKGLRLIAAILIAFRVILWNKELFFKFRSAIYTTLCQFISFSKHFLWYSCFVYFGTKHINVAVLLLFE